MQAVLDRSASFIADLMYQLGAGDPVGWMLLGVGMAAVFVFLVRPPR